MDKLGFSVSFNVGPLICRDTGFFSPGTSNVRSSAPPSDACNDVSMGFELMVASSRNDSTSVSSPCNALPRIED